MKSERFASTPNKSTYLLFQLVKIEGLASRASDLIPEQSDLLDLSILDFANGGIDVDRSEGEPRSVQLFEDPPQFAQKPHLTLFCKFFSEWRFLAKTTDNRLQLMVRLTTTSHDRQPTLDLATCNCTTMGDICEQLPKVGRM